MRARKLAAVAPEDLPPPEDGADPWPGDDLPASEDDADGGPFAHLCIDCGTDGCRDHGEAARLDAPSRAVIDAVGRLRRAVAEQKAAARALRVLVLSEVARGRGDLEIVPAVKAEPCPRCLIRDAEDAAAQTTKPKRRAKGEGQQALPFVKAS